MLMLNL
jgi:hypothetical protein